MEAKVNISLLFYNELSWAKYSFIIIAITNKWVWVVYLHSVVIERVMFALNNICYYGRIRICCNVDLLFDERTKNKQKINPNLKGYLRSDKNKVHNDLFNPCTMIFRQLFDYSFGKCTAHSEGKLQQSYVLFFLDYQTLSGMQQSENIIMEHNYAHGQILSQIHLSYVKIKYNGFNFFNF